MYIVQLYIYYVVSCLVCMYYRGKSLSSCYNRLEGSKCREYQDRIINVEHGSFSPLVFTTSGGMGPSSKIVYKRLASLLSLKLKEHYSRSLLFIRCSIGFALLRSAIQCFRGSRSSYKSPLFSISCVDLALSEGQVSY